MKAGDICKKSGHYCCGYHQKNKIKMHEGSTFPGCNYNGLRCEGFWCWLKPLNEKSEEEKRADYNRKRYKEKRPRKYKDPDDYSFYTEKTKWDDWKKW